MRKKTELIKAFVDILFFYTAEQLFSFTPVPVENILNLQLELEEQIKTALYGLPSRFLAKNDELNFFLSRNLSHDNFYLRYAYFVFYVLKNFHEKLDLHKLVGLTFHLPQTREFLENLQGEGFKGLDPFVAFAMLFTLAHIKLTIKLDDLSLTEIKKRINPGAAVFLYEPLPYSVEIEIINEFKKTFEPIPTSTLIVFDKF